MTKERRVYEVDLKESNENSEVLEISCRVVLTREAIFGCKDGQVSPEVAVSLLEYATEYLLDKRIGDRFTIACEALRTVISGVITEDDSDKDIQVVVTNIFGNAYFVQEEGVFNIEF